jgi:hypothetical protein
MSIKKKRGRVSEFAFRKMCIDPDERWAKKAESK